MIKENFIKLYENSFKENWDLPCYTDYGDGYSLGDVAVDWATVNVKGAHVYDFTGDRWGQIWPATTDYFGIPR